ncbi:MAG TPA: nitroreductase family deazaflavin-dependent oxidoreductase [Ktedonobacterales bacterium]|nr:nitroreductase family deazaflavin-dependent oxidoreductase [Ktedonobacterales bacterium]
MAKTYRVTFAVRLSNKLIEFLLRAGVKIGPMVLLTVRGRKSGQPRTTPVALGERNGQRVLVGTFGNVNWVRNLRAAGEATLTRRRRSEEITVRELPPEEAAVALKEILPTAPNFIKAYFDVTPDAPLEEFIQEAPRHPIFEVLAKVSADLPAKEEAVR